MKFSPLKTELIKFILISSCNFFELLFASIHDLNTNLNSWRHNLYDYIVRFGEKIICKLHEEETIFISAFNAENFIKIR